MSLVKQMDRHNCAVSHCKNATKLAINWLFIKKHATDIHATDWRAGSKVIIQSKINNSRCILKIRADNHENIQERQSKSI